MVGEDCLVFIGAGLSMPLGYPDWNGLIRLLVEQARRIDGGAEELAGVSTRESVADVCKRVLTDEGYFRLIADTFQPRLRLLSNGKKETRDEFRPIHVRLMQLPFSAYLTTNFDLCLEMARPYASSHNRTPGRQVYPGLDPTRLRDKVVCHIHGVAWDEDGTCQSRSIVLTSADYEKAYACETGQARHFLLPVFKHQAILFVGVSFQDREVQNLVAAAAEQYEMMRIETSERGVDNLPDKEHFALLPMTYAYDSTSNPSCLPVRKRDAATEIQQDQELSHKYHISVIRYDTTEDDPVHVHLDQTIEFLGQLIRSMRRAPSPSAEEVFTEKDYVP